MLVFTAVYLWSEFNENWWKVNTCSCWGAHWENQHGWNVSCEDFQSRVCNMGGDNTAGRYMWCETERGSYCGLDCEMRGDKNWCSNQGRQHWYVYPSISIIILHPRYLCGFFAFLSAHACVYLLYISACVSCACSFLSHYSMLLDHFWVLTTGLIFHANEREGLSYDSVHTQSPSLYHKWTSTGTLSLLEDLPWL